MFDIIPEFVGQRANLQGIAGGPLSFANSVFPALLGYLTL
jgi:hypothetical protein